jgi:uncharacterized protein involved in outer membrane biogenesis
MGLKDRLNAALERANAGRQAKLTAKSEVAAQQGNMKKAAKLDVRSKKVALRSEMREARNTPKFGTVKNPYNADAMKSNLDKFRTSSMSEMNKSTPPPTTGSPLVPRGIGEAVEEYKRKNNRI